MIEMIHMSDIVVKTINNNVGIDPSECKVGVMATTTFMGPGSLKKVGCWALHPKNYFSKSNEFPINDRDGPPVRIIEWETDILTVEIYWFSILRRFYKINAGYDI